LLTLDWFGTHLSNITSASEFVVGYSGGLDSHVLLLLMAGLRRQGRVISIRAVHVNHGLSDNADVWQQHCQNVCDQLNVPLSVEKIKLDIKSGDSLEAVARDHRYHIFSEYCGPDECLLTAHTQTDQAETMLLQLLRGAGPKGLASMPTQKSFYQGEHVRPLLLHSREELQVYAEQHQLQWIEDDSNTDERFDRNFLRHQIFPRLKQRWSGVEKSMSRVAAHSAEAVELLEQQADVHLRAMWDGNSKQLYLSALLNLNDAQQRNVLRRWLHRMKIVLPNSKKLIEIQEQINHAKKDANLCVRWGCVSIRRYREHVYLVHDIKPHDANTIIPWDGKSELLLPADIGKLDATVLKQFQIDINSLTLPLTVRFRRGGEVLQLPQRAHTHDLKKCLQEWGVPPWQRDRLPLIYHGDDLICVVRDDETL